MPTLDKGPSTLIPRETKNSFLFWLSWVLVAIGFAVALGGVIVAIWFEPQVEEFIVEFMGVR